MSAGIGKKAATAQTLIAQSVAATEHAHCAKATIKAPPDCTEHPHARISFQQLIAYCCHPKTNPGLPTEARVGIVVMGGIEPPSSGRPRILLRAQSTVLFLSPQHCADTPLDRLS